MTYEDKVNELNTYFISVFTHEQCPPPNIGQRAFTTPLSDIQISLEDITLRLKKINPNKTPSPDNQHPCVFRELYDILDVLLLLIFRKTLEKGRLPESWKQAKITPIQKKNREDCPATIDLLASRALHARLWNPSLESILCSIWNVRLLLRTPAQFPLWQITITQLLEVLDNWFSFYDEHTCVDTIYLDLSKAFNSVPHTRLIAQLESYGITGKDISWITGFLNNRKQDVCINGTVSKWAKVMSEVPQGSVLGPVIFIIYINSFPDSVTNHIKLFVGDRKLWVPVKTIEN